jgi:hypothetical protein
VKEWKPAKKIGKRVYDDKAFVESVKEQAAGTKPLSARQLEFLVRMVLMYSDQIPDAEAKLKESGLGAGAAVVKRADAELVKYCFQTVDRIGGMMKNPFIKSLREQVDRGKGLSQKQFQILARAVGENAGALEDSAEVRAKLGEFVPEGFGSEPTDPTIPGILKLMETVTEWRPKSKKGKKVYDDKSFVKSLADQYARRQSLSSRQIMALKRVAVAYRDKIPGYDGKAAELGLVNIPSSTEKSANVIDGPADE